MNDCTHDLCEPDDSGLCIDVVGDAPCEPGATIKWLCETGKTGRFLHMAENHARQWYVLCALEDALIDAGVNNGWLFVVGRLGSDQEVQGWMVCDGWAIVPFGPARSKSTGYHLGVYELSGWTAEVEPDVWAATPAEPESGTILNRALRASFHLGPDECLGEP